MAQAPSPNAVTITKARHDRRLTQTQAANLVGVTLRSWQSWESGQHKMPSGLWELFQIKTRPN